MALVYPNTYHVGMSSLGFQLVYQLLNNQDDLVCERFFLPEGTDSLVSIESGRPLNDFALVYISISFEHDYVNLVRLLLASGIQPVAEKRSEMIEPGSPLVLCGGVVTLINPEPLAPFVDLFYVGEAENQLLSVTTALINAISSTSRIDILGGISREFVGCYVPRFYKPVYGQNGSQVGWQRKEGLSERVGKYVFDRSDCASHSQILTPETEFAELYLTELGRGCSRGCRFCTAGFIYRPPRLWDADAVVKGLEERFDGVKRIGLLGMEMAKSDDLATISGYLTDSGCALSFSSLRADRLNSDLIALLKESNLKSVAIAPDGSSERLRKVINKSLSENDILSAAEKLISAGIFKLKLYLMVGLPTERKEDLHEAIELVGKIKDRIDPIGRERGRLCEIVVSVNCFSPKPWTPFQYHAFGVSEKLSTNETHRASDSIYTLKSRLKFLKKGFSRYSNVIVNTDKPENVLFQAVLAKGDRRLATVLLLMAGHGKSWKQAMKQADLTAEEYAIKGYNNKSFLPWEIIDHNLKDNYLWQEYIRSFEGKLTAACRTDVCRQFVVCGEE